VALLSATERIIRDAEAAEARRSAADERPAEAIVLPDWSEPTPSPPGPLPEANTEPKAVPMFADGYPEYDDLSDGITRVDLNRSALALEKLRAFDAQPPSGGIRSAGLTAGGQPSPVAQRALPVSGAATAMAELPGVPRRGPPPGRPIQLADAPSPELPAPRGPSAALPESAAPMAEPLVAVHRSRSLSLRHPPRVGRRVGLVIAAATAAAVAPLIGSWTSRFESAASARGGAEASPVSATAPSVTSIPAPQAIATVVVPAAAPDPGPGSPSPARQPTLPLEPPGKVPASSPDSAERGAPSDSGAKARLLAAVEPRPAHRSSGGKKSRQRAHQTKVTTVAAQPAAAPRAAGPSPGSARRDPRPSGDPDDTLPIAIE